jgi:hypothetical protein
MDDVSIRRITDFVWSEHGMWTEWNGEEMHVRGDSVSPHLPHAVCVYFSAFADIKFLRIYVVHCGKSLQNEGYLYLWNLPNMGIET